MSEPKTWWRNWAPFWAHLEDRHLSLLTTQKILTHVSSPVLVIGAGQGLVVEYLRQNGLEADGVDLEKEMIRLAHKRRSIELIQANANALPFKKNHYQTAIVATGVVDYLHDKTLIVQILKETIDIVEDNGKILVSFYKIEHVIEEVYRKLGVITPENTYYLKRIFEIKKQRKTNPRQCVKMIRKWTGEGILSTMTTLIKLGLLPPEILKHEEEKIDAVFSQAVKQGVDVQALHESVPGGIPYRDTEEIKKLFREASMNYQEIVEAPDCIIVVLKK